jgi:hypothetical protein
MFLRKPTYKRFEYTPRFYDPAKEERERGRRIHFERPPRRGPGRSIFILVAMFILAYLLYSFLR